MQLIKYLRNEKDKNGNWFGLGLFLCPYCLQEVVRRFSAGKKQKSCGCVANKLKSEAKKGIKKSEEHKQKISKTRIEKGLAKGENNPFYDKKHSEESIQKMKDKIFTENYRQKISDGVKERWKDGDYRKKQESRTRELSSNWQNGKSFEPYGIEFNKELKN